MYVSIFDINVDEITITDLAVTLRLKDADGNCVNLFFNNLWDTREFARNISKLTEKAGLERGWDND